jgi:2'-5' RNA ligase
LSEREPNFFVAFPFAHEAALRGLPPPPPKVRVFPLFDLHLTLAFLGPCGEATARCAFDTVDPSTIEPFALTALQATLLGNPRKPTAIAREIGGADAPRLVETIGRLRGPALAATSAPPERRPPLPHLTIARIGRRASAHERERAEAWTAAITARPEVLGVDDVALYTRADDDPRHSYRIVERRRLG